MVRGKAIAQPPEYPYFMEILEFAGSTMDDGRVVATYTATDLSKTGGKVLDDAGRGTVRIRRRGTSYVLMREELLDSLLAAAREGRPQSLEDLVRGYDSGKLKTLTRGFLDDPPVGKERV